MKEVVRLALGLETKEDDRFHSEKASACLDALGLRVFGLTPSLTAVRSSATTVRPMKKDTARRHARDA
ncbi:hypothetical protein ACFQ0T_37800 [Kitasatospora gansuensis]